MVYKVRNHKLSEGASNVQFIKSPNVSGKLTGPKFVVVHYTASGPGANIAEYFAKPSARVSAHIVIRRDGTVIQCVPFNVKGWHAGQSTWVAKDGKTYNGLNATSIGIEIENWGPLKWTGSAWVSWTGASVESSRVIEARHKYGTPDCGWEIFTEAQILATIDVAQALCEEYGIGEIVGHDDISPGRKSDPGPAWNMDSFRAKVFGRSDDGDATFVVRSATGLNIRSGPGASHSTLRDTPLADGTHVLMHEAEGQWRFVSVLDGKGNADFSGWVHGNWLYET